MAAPPEHPTVFCRVRAPTEEEAKNIVVVASGSHVNATAPHARPKTFNFAKAFPPTSSPDEIFNAVAEPYVAEVMKGYSCNIFVFGQSNSGKTDVMFGDGSTTGLIPQFARALFSTMRESSKEAQASVSCLQIYNEELRDMVTGQKQIGKKLRMVDDASRKGALIVQGLDEVVLRHNMSGFFSSVGKNIEELSDEMRRSHLIVSFTAHIITIKSDGEEVITGKMNFIRVAGSESISKAQGVQKVKEAATTTQSLQSFNRILGMLAEGSKHLPFRESKLTRFVQDALGGKGKASFVFTVSPGLADLQESFFTLELSIKAKAITCHPELCSSYGKSFLIQRYEEEIKQLMEEMRQALNKDGVYVAHENYARVQQEEMEHQEKMNGLMSEIKAAMDNMQFLKKHCDKAVSEKNELKSQVRAATSKLVSETSYNEKAQTKVSALKKEVEKAQDAGRAVLDDLDKMHGRLDRDLQVHKMHAAAKQQLRAACDAELNDLRQLVEQHKAANKSTWNALNKIEAVVKNSEQTRRRRQALEDSLRAIEAHFNDLSSIMKQQVEIYERFLMTEGGRDERMHAAMRAKMENLVRVRRRCLESVLGVAGTALGSHRAFVDEALRRLAEIVGRSDRCRALSRKLRSDYAESVAAESRKYSDAVGVVQSGAEEMYLEVSKLLLDVVPKMEAACGAASDAAERAAEKVERMRGAAVVVTEDADRFERGRALGVAEAGKEVAAVDAERRAAIAGAVAFVEGEGRKEEEMFAGNRKEMAALNSEAAEAVRAGVAAVADLRGERLEDLRKFQDEASGLRKSKAEACKNLMESVSEAAEGQEEFGRKNLDAIRADLKEFVGNLDDAVAASTCAVGLIEAKAADLKDKCREFDDKFVEDTRTGATPFRKEYSLVDKFTPLTPRRN